MTNTDQNQVIALIEDEDLIRDLYKRQLEKAGLSVVAFDSGQSALEWFKKHTADLVLLDVMLPDINGIEILRQLKADERTKKMRVLLLTNLGQETILKEAECLGAEGHFIKVSYTPSQVVELVQSKLTNGSNITK